MFEKMQAGGNFFGYTLTRGPHFFFFGSRRVTQDDLITLFPQYEFCFLKQVHGQTVAEARTFIDNEADAHFTKKPGLALVVQSADCIPILLAGEGGVCAIHAGWRGVAANIVGAAAAALPAEFKISFAAVGPHIGFNSFEVGGDVRDQLARSCKSGDGMCRPGAPGKFYFDLKSAANAQLAAAFPGVTLGERGDDTFTSAAFHSFRRDHESAGRQFSFVVINSPRRA